MTTNFVAKTVAVPLDRPDDTDRDISDAEKRIGQELTSVHNRLVARELSRRECLCGLSLVFGNDGQWRHCWRTERSCPGCGRESLLARTSQLEDGPAE